MIHPLFRFLTTGSLLAVAFLMPLPLPVQGFDSSVARQPATARQRDSQPQPQVLTFPDLVTPQSLKPLDQLPKSAQMLELHFVEKPGFAHGPAAKDQIWMPARGDFKLRLKAGDSFSVLDPDGTDGEAVVQMPQNSVWEGFLKAAPSADKKAVASLKLVDPLYYVNQELAGKDKTGASQWWRLGLRSFPVAADWPGPDGADSVLSFTNQNVSAFHLVWAKSTASKPDFPVGVAEIGPGGGVVELPGVAKLEIPSGALASLTVVKITQIKEAPERGAPPPNPKDPMFEFHQDTIGHEYASPVIRIDPFNLTLTKTALLYLTLLDPIYTNTKLGFAYNLVSQDINNIYYGIKSLEETERMASPIKIDEFLYFGKLAEYGWLQEWKPYYSFTAPNKTSN